MGICQSRSKIELGVLLPDGVAHIQQEDQHGTATALEIATVSFCGDAGHSPEGTMDWNLGPKLKEQWGDARRAKMMRWFMDFSMQMCYRENGFVLAATLDNGDFGAVVFAHVRLSGNPGTCQMLSLMCCGPGLPPLFQMGDAKWGIMKRLEAIADKTEPAHERLMPGPHVFISVMAVTPSAQGKGLCGKLMRLVNVWADKNGLPVYLETSGDKNVAVYKRFGYEVAEQLVLQCDGDPDESEPLSDEYIMIRPATTKA